MGNLILDLVFLFQIIQDFVKRFLIVTVVTFFRAIVNIFNLFDNLIDGAVLSLSVVSSFWTT